MHNIKQKTNNHLKEIVMQCAMLMSEFHLLTSTEFLLRSTLPDPELHQEMHCTRQHTPDLNSLPIYIGLHHHQGHQLEYI